MSIQLDGSVAVLTGAGSGIGNATAISLAARGARIVVTDIDAERAAATARAIGDRAVSLRCDVTDAAELEAARDLALDRFGRVDIVMNNVGFPAVGRPDEIPVEAWKQLIDVNLLGIVRSNLVFLPLLLAQRSGHLVNTASIAGLFPYAGGFERLPYVATKYAVVGMSESLATYLRPRGIGVSCLCPAFVPTNIAEQVRSWGTPIQPKRPGYPSLDAAAVGERVADAIEANRFLIVTAEGVVESMRDRADDIDAFIDRVAEESGGAE